MKRSWGVIGLLAASLACGALLGEANFRFFEKAVPPVAMGSVTMSAMHATCVLIGLGLGAFLFLWGLVAIWLAPMFRGRKKRAE